MLNALVQERLLDDESLSTLMCEVESIVNGRPWSKVSDDSHDLEPLTPNHLHRYLLGSLYARIFIPGVADARFNTCLMCFGAGGRKNIFPVYRGDKDGPSHNEIFKLGTLSLLLMRRLQEGYGHLVALSM